MESDLAYSNLLIAGHTPPAQNGGMVAFRRVTPGYFDALGIRIDAGRGFEESDRISGPPPVILSATLARRTFGGEIPWAANQSGWRSWLVPSFRSCVRRQE